MDDAARSGIQKASDGAAYIPASRRADGSTRKEIKVRPGYTPPEDVETYKNRNAQAVQSKGRGGVPGAEGLIASSTESSESRSKNAKRRDAAKRKALENADDQPELVSAMHAHSVDASSNGKASHEWRGSNNVQTDATVEDIAIAEREKKIRNLLKKLKAVQDLKEKKSSGEKLSHDQLLKVGKESELERDLRKLGHEGSENSGTGTKDKDGTTDNLETDEID